MVPRRSILIVDDEPDLRDCLAMRLRSAGHAVRAVGDADEALAAVLEATPGLILLDLRLGDRSGHALLEQLHRLADARRVPVICLTASTRSSDRERARGRGVEAYITKPFDPAGLLATIDRVLAASA